MRILDAVGFLAWEHGRPILDQAMPVAVADIAEASRTPAPGSTLTTAREVHQLSPSAAQRAYSVCLHAVVTYFDAFNHLLFVQDSSDGIFVELSEQNKVLLRAGDRVEVTGVTTTDFAPDVANARVIVLGHPGLPAPKIESFGNANWGREDCHWLELGGTVQRVAQGAGDTLLTMAWGKNTYKAHVLASAESLATLVDAEVTLRGVCGALFNRKRQMLGIQMFLPGAECIRVVRPAATDLFAVAPTPIGGLLQFSPRHDMAHQRKGPGHGNVRQPVRVHVDTGCHRRGDDPGPRCGGTGGGRSGGCGGLSGNRWIRPCAARLARPAIAIRRAARAGTGGGG